MLAGAAGAGPEPVLEGRRAARVEERRARTDAEEARHLERATGTDVARVVVRRQRAVVAGHAADHRLLEDRLAARDRRRIDERGRRGRRDAIEPRAERRLLALAQDAAAHALREHVV